MRITRIAKFEGELLDALARPQGEVIWVMLDAEVITARATLSTITEQALKQK